MSKLSVKIETFKPRRSNTLFGIIDIVVLEMHLRIKDATVHESHGRRWVGLPAKPMITREGQALRDERGKIAYSAVLQFTDRATADAFSARTIAALLERDPDAFEEGAS